MDPIRADSLLGIKHFGIFVSEPEIDISSPLNGTDWIKHAILKWTPYGISAFADSLRGIKHLDKSSGLHTGSASKAPFGG